MGAPAPLNAVPEASTPEITVEQPPKPSSNTFIRKWVIEKKGRRVTQDSMMVAQQLRML